MAAGGQLKKGGDSSPGSPASSDSDSEGGSEVEAEHGNRSLNGIILHIMADIAQSFGLTIAGAILWCDALPSAPATFWGNIRIAVG